MTSGTRGDVQPFMALARGLLTAGYEVVLAAP
ncbi:UNVERIFIED_CONTAM: UDP:flavonoid glycosyltransferase YjiC (YdhE family) [Jeotgalibacillus campisalis]